MPRAASARRYAQAVYQLAVEADELDVWLEDLSLLVRALESEEFSRFLDAPQASAAQKTEVARQAMGQSVGPLAVNLLALLSSRNLAHLVPEIADQYEVLLDNHRGIERAEVVSAVPLDDGQRRRVEDLLRGVAGRDVRMTERVDPAILGGLVARVGDRVIDGSTRTKLSTMRRDLVDRRS
jgi:F-type H+-transporting ATPase subunit delta